MKNLILIPTALNVDKDLHLDIGEVPPILVPISGKPLLYYILEQYKSLTGENTFCLLVNENKDKIKEILENRGFGEEIFLVEIDQIKSLGWTIYEGLSKLNLSEYDRLYINFGDTLVNEDLNLDLDIVAYDTIFESGKWTTFDIIDQKIQNIKNKIPTAKSEEKNIFVGVFKILNLKEFYESFFRVENKSFYEVLSLYLSQKLEYKVLKTDHWYDVGHIENYYKAKKDFINLRYFNSINIDTQRNILKKTSTHKKFLGEIKWYLQIPRTLQSFLPRVFDYSLDPDNPYIKMEYYGYLNLGEIFTFGNYNLSIWDDIFSSVFFILKEFSKYTFEENKEKAKAARKSIFLEKTMNAFAVLEERDEFKTLFDHEIIINGKKYFSLNFYKSQIENLCEELGLINDQKFNLIHGDFCISNILYEPKNKLIKLIDPRGNFGGHTVYGDFKYDLGKLSHSFNGLYEFIINDLFNLEEVGKNQFKVNYFLNSQHKLISKKFNFYLEKNYPELSNVIQLIEGLQFLSMTRMHFPETKRQFVMLFRGIQLIDPLIRKEKRINVVLPMGGLGSRFSKYGITIPKPLIKLKDKHLIEWALSSIPNKENYNFIAIVRKEHVDEFKIDEKLKELVSEDLNIITLDYLTEGAASTVLLAKDYINNDDPLIILDCDIFLKIPKYFEMIKDSELDGLVPVFKGEGDKWSFSKLDLNNHIVEIAEKNRISEYCNMGMYYFGKGKTFVNCAEEMIGENQRVNGEFYISPIYQKMIAKGAKVKAELCEEAWNLGTLPDLLDFENKYFNFKNETNLE